MAGRWRENPEKMARDAWRKPGSLVVALIQFTLLTLVFCGCGMEGGIRRLVGNRVPDFKKTEIIAGSPVPADGSAELALLIHLKNSDGTPIPDYKPEYSVVAGDGVVPHECTTSDSNGLSACFLKATVAGVKRLRLMNALAGLEREVAFEPPRGNGRIIGLVPGAESRSATASGHRVQISVGDPVRGVGGSTPDGSKVMFSVQGVLVSP